MLIRAENHLDGQLHPQGAIKGTTCQKTYCCFSHILLHDSGHNACIKVKSCETMKNYEIFLTGPLYRCSKIWEMLEPKIQRATTKIKFKNYLRPMDRPNNV